MNILLVGCGKMGGALLAQWVKHDGASISVVDPAASDLPDAARLYKDIGALETEFFDLIIVAVKPQMIDDVMPPYKSLLAPNGFIASIAAGYMAQRLADLFGTTKIVRVMPNLPAEIGRGVSGLFALPDVSAEHRDGIEALLRLAGGVVWVDTEDALDRVTAIAGSGPGYVFEIARCFVEAAKQLGFTDEQARDLVLDTMAGTVEMARDSNETLETLRNNVTSKNGVTQAGLEQFHADQRLAKLFEAVTQAAYDRAVELR